MYIHIYVYIYKYVYIERPLRIQGTYRSLDKRSYGRQDVVEGLIVVDMCVYVHICTCVCVYINTYIYIYIYIYICTYTGYIPQP